MNNEEILYQIVAVDSELKKGFPDEITTILKNGITGKIYTDYDFKNHRYLYCFINDNFNIYDRLEEKDKEIERLKAREQECIDKYLAQSKYRSEVEGKYVLAKYVVDELEKWLEEYIPLLEAGDICDETTQDTLKEVLDKLKALKEGKEC